MNIRYFVEEMKYIKNKVLNQDKKISLLIKNIKQLK